MEVTPSTREYLDSHLGQAEFALKVATNFECPKGTPAHGIVREALARVEGPRNWVRENIAITNTFAPRYPPLGDGLPLTRKERLGHRWP